MPCYDPGASEASEAECRRKLNKLTAHLCRLCQITEDSKGFMPEEIKKWWEKHKKDDRKRMAEGR